MPDDLRARIAEALNTTPAQFIQDDPDEGGWFKDRPYRRHDQHRYDGGCAMCRGETDTLVQAVIAVVQPELERLVAERDQAHRDCQSYADLASGAERTRQFHKDDADRYEEQLRQERDRYRLAWQSARRERARLRGIIAANWETAETFQDGGVNDIAELYRAQDAIQAAGGQLTRPVHQAIDAIRAKWDRVLRSEQQKRADVEVTIARVTALAADMRTWCSPHGLADHYANQLDQAITGAEPTNEET
jgi:hypothetical protein